tara:strand:+ start:2064 stop:2669 length:606 start_codon:yes stop_codon:yes gene_type:complete
MNKNQLNSGSLETLKPDETLLMSARKVNGGKLQLEFAEVIKNGKGMNVLGILNKSDERFSSSARRAWVTAEPNDAEESFGINFGVDAGWEATDRGEILFLDILNPTIDGTRCRVQINETVEATEWQEENKSRAAKRKGKDGDFITHDGNYIYSNTTVLLTNDTPTHTILQPDAVTISEMIDTTTGEVLEAVEAMNEDDLPL